MDGGSSARSSKTLKATKIPTQYSAGQKKMEKKKKKVCKMMEERRKDEMRGD